MTLRKKPFKNFVVKRDNAVSQHYLLFLQCFLPFPYQISIFHSRLFCRLQLLSISKILSFGKALNIVEKGKYGGDQHVLLLSQCVKKAFSFGFIKVWTVKGKENCLSGISALYFMGD